MKPTLILAALAILGAPLHGQGHAPEAWLVALDSRADSIVEFSPMAPGWHITMGPGGVLYPAARTHEGRFSLESRFVLFPGTSTAEFGLMVGGRGLSDSSRAWVAFVIRRDGSAGVLRHANGRVEPLVPWAPHRAVKAHPGDNSTVTNVLRVTFDTAFAFRVNDSLVVTVPRDQVGSDGVFGFRVGKDLNIHITTLDVTHRLAPAR